MPKAALPPKIWRRRDSGNATVQQLSYSTFVEFHLGGVALHDIMDHRAYRKGLAATTSLLSAATRQRGASHVFLQKRNASSHLPTIAQTSFWKSLIPKPLRREKLPPDAAALRKSNRRSKEWNPATFYIIIFLLIGSMSVQSIALRKDFEAFKRQSDVRIGLLKEVIGRVQKGEKVDVEKVLGTGDPQREEEWAEGMQ